MPKIAEKHSAKVKRYATQYSDIFSVQTDVITNSQILYCQCCCERVSCDQKSHVDQHLASKSHKEKCRNFKSKQTSVQNYFTNNQKLFNSDLCEFAIGLNIAFNCFSHPIAKNFFNKWTDYKLPDPSTLWKSYLNPIYDKQIETIRNLILDQHIWVNIHINQIKLLH